MSRETNTKEEKDLQPDEVSWNERKEQAEDHAPPGAPKKGSLLKDLADEALSKGRPVLVIPLDGAAHEAEAEANVDEEDEPPHEMRLPKNTTVIFAGNEGFPATTRMSRAHHVRGDLGEDGARRPSPPDIPDRATGLRIVDPSQAGVPWNRPSVEPTTGESGTTGQPDRAEGGHR